MIEPLVHQDFSPISKHYSGGNTENVVINFDLSKRGTTTLKVGASMNHRPTLSFLSSSSEKNILCHEKHSGESTLHKKDKILISNKDIPIINPECLFKRKVYEKIPIKNTNSLLSCNIFADSGTIRNKVAIKDCNLISNKDIPMMNLGCPFNRTVYEKIPIKNTNSVVPCNIFADYGKLARK